ncbi:MAG: hypothetical protein KIPDCIKN_00396 [Haliscomenobacter sp.]|nr:hypothetical protein [Haliscomenobacter sp.]
MLLARVAPVEVRQFHQHFLPVAAYRERVHHLRIKAVVAAQKLVFRICPFGKERVAPVCHAIQRILDPQFGLEQPQHLFRRGRCALIAPYQARQVQFVVYLAAAVVFRRIVILYDRVARRLRHLVLQALEQLVAKRDRLRAHQVNVLVPLYEVAVAIRRRERPLQPRPRLVARRNPRIR